MCNLLDEGNAAFREGDWTLARGHFSEGVSVARYAQGEGVTVPAALLESLYVNRAAAQHNMVSCVGFTSIFITCIPLFPLLCVQRTCRTVSVNSLGRN